MSVCFTAARECSDRGRQPKRERGGSEGGFNPQSQRGIALLQSAHFL